MGFRTLDLSKACEIHIKEGQLSITSEDGTAVIPIEDLSQIMVHGANIRLGKLRKNTIDALKNLHLKLVWLEC